MTNYSKISTDELESMRDQYQDQLAECFDDDSKCNQIQYEIDLIEDELNGRPDFFED